MQNASYISALGCELAAQTRAQAPGPAELLTLLLDVAREDRSRTPR